MGNVADAGNETRQDLPADVPAEVALAAGVTVREVLDTPALSGARLLAGASGLDRVVRRLNVMEVPDVLPWVKAHELLLTTGYPVRSTPDGVPSLLAALDDRGLAAVGIKLNRYLDELPADALKVADERGLPLIQLPDGVGLRRHPQPGVDRGPEPAGVTARTKRGGAPRARGDRPRRRGAERAGARDGRRPGRPRARHHGRRAGAGGGRERRRARGAAADVVLRAVRPFPHRARATVAFTGTTTSTAGTPSCRSSPASSTTAGSPPSRVTGHSTSGISTSWSGPRPSPRLPSRSSSPSGPWKTSTGATSSVTCYRPGPAIATGSSRTASHWAGTSTGRWWSWSRSWTRRRRRRNARAWSCARCRSASPPHGKAQFGCATPGRRSWVSPRRSWRWWGYHRGPTRIGWSETWCARCPGTEEGAAARSRPG